LYYDPLTKKDRIHNPGHRYSICGLGFNDVSNKAQHQRRCENKAAAANNSSSDDICNDNSSFIDSVNKEANFVSKPVVADE
jgi:hypothetical protein